MGNRALGKRSFNKGEQRRRETCWSKNLKRYKTEKRLPTPRLIRLDGIKAIKAWLMICARKNAAYRSKATPE